MPVISVIVPVYKVESYLCNCVDSILAQTFTDFELILIDDGSPDNCGQICDEYAKKDKRIIVIHQENKGVSAARNAGLDKARGDYVYFVDSDDYLVHNAFETFINVANKGYDMVCFSANFVDKNGSFISVYYHETGKYLITEEKDKIIFILGKLLAGKTGWDTWNRVYRRDIIEAHKLRFVESITFAEDLYFCLCYCFYTNSIFIIDDILYNYRIRDNSIMRDNVDKLNVGKMNELSKSVYEFVIRDESLKYIRNVFPGIHLLILDNAISRSMKSGRYSLKELRKAILDDVKDKEYFFSEYKHTKECYQYLRLAYSEWELKEKLNFTQYLISNNYVFLCIKNRIIKFQIRFSKEVL